MAVKGLNFNLGARVTGQSAFTSFQRALQAITAAGNSAKTSMRGVSDGVKSAADSASVFRPLLDNVDRVNRAFGESVNKIHGVGREMRSAADSASVFQAEFNRLQAKFNPAAAQVRQVEQSMGELTRAYTLGAVSAEQYALEMVNLKNNLQTVTTAQRGLVPATNSIGAAADQANRNMGSWNRGLSDTRRAVQAAGFQINDFFLQVAGGQNIVLAFTQQAGQLVQFFGAWGSVAGAALAIGGALWLMFGQGEDSMKKAEDALQSLNGALSAFNSNADLAMTDVEELRKRYGQWAEEIRDVARQMVAVNTSQALTALKEGALGATAALSDVNEQQRIANEIALDRSNLGSDTTALLYADQMAAVDELASALGMSAAQADQLYLAIGKFHGSGSMLEMRDNSASVLATLKAIYGESTNIPTEITKMWTEFANVNREISQGLTTLGETNTQMSTVTTSGTLLADVLRIGAEYLERMKTTLAGMSFSGLARSVMGVTDAAGGGKPLSSFSGGGFTGTGSRTGGVDGQGGFLAVLHPNETVIDHALGTVAGGGGFGGAVAPLADDVLVQFQSVAKGIANAFMSAFSGILKGTKSVKDAATEMLNAVLDKTIELLMMPVFEGIAGFVSKGIFGAVGGLGTLPSFDGGGSTGSGARSGGLDGKGGFLSIMHPKETVTDHTRGGGQSGGVTINVIVDGATGNGEIMEMVSRGVSTGLKYYDAKVLPQSLKRVSANPRRM